MDLTVLRVGCAVSLQICLKVFWLLDFRFSRVLPCVAPAQTGAPTTTKSGRRPGAPRATRWDPLFASLSYARLVPTVSSLRGPLPALGSDRNSVLGRSQRSTCSLQGPDPLVCGSFRAILHGDYTEVEIATAAHEGLLKDFGLLTEDRRLLGAWVSYIQFRRPFSCFLDTAFKLAAKKTYPAGSPARNLPRKAACELSLLAACPVHPSWHQT